MATGKISTDNVRYSITSFASGMTGLLNVAINKTSRSCIISGYINTSNKTAEALISTSTDLDYCIANKLIPVSTNALPVWSHTGEFKFNSDYVAWTGTGGINTINVAYTLPA